MLHSISINESLWQSLVSLGKRKRKKPALLAEQAVRDFLQRMDDEDLLDRSAKQAQKKGLSLSVTESLIRKYRNQK